MTSLHSRRATYVAAFLLGALIAILIARPARSAGPVLTSGSYTVHGESATQAGLKSPGR